MKDAVTLLLCAVALANGFDLKSDLTTRTCNCNPSEAEQICQAEFGNDDVLIAHENCDKFYKCSNGKPVAYDCPTNLLYNPYTETCDWPNNVECGDRPISDGSETDEDCDEDTGADDENVVGGDNNNGTCNCNPDEAPALCAAEDSNGILIANENCNQFYMCAEGRPVSLSCPPSLLYNPYKEECDWPENVDCGDRVIPEHNDDDAGNDNNSDGNDSNGNENTCNCNPEEAQSICAADGSDGVLIAHENCNQFYKCAYGKPVAFDCPNGLLFNPFTEQCDWAHNVDCGDRLVPETESGCSSCNGSDNADVTPPCDDVESDSVSIEELPPAGDDTGNDIDDLPPAGDDTGNDIDDLPPADDDTGNDIDDLPPSGDDTGNDIDDLPPSGDDTGNDIDDFPVSDDNGENDSSDIDSLPPSSDDAGNDSDNAGTCNCYPEDAPAICAGGDSDGILIAHENCNQFYKCDHGKPVVFDCPLNLLYNPYTEECDWPENVDCGDRVIIDSDDSNDVEDSPDTDSDSNDNGGNGGSDNDNDSIGAGNCDPNEAPTICAADNSDDVLVAHENCNQFYICSEGKPVALTCPDNLLFNPNTDRCDWPENVDCGDRIIPDAEDNNVDVENSPGNDSSSNDNDNGNNDNGSSDNIGGGNCDPSEAPTICAADDSNGILVAHENCNQFYICSDGKPVVLTCPANLLFNPIIDQCDWPQNVDCGDREIPDPNEDDTDNDNGDVEDSPPGDNNPGNDNGDVEDSPPGDNNPGNDNGSNDSDGTCNCNPEEAPAICAGGDSDGILIAHENCNQFYKCDHGKPVAFTCPSNLLYNPITEACDWPENVECGDRVIPDPENDSDDTGNDNGDVEDSLPGDNNPGNDNGDVEDSPAGGNNPGNDNGSNDSDGTCNCNPEEAPAICAGGDSDGILIAHENCNQFYKCDHGKPVAFTCPNDLLYNPIIEVCDWPENVECGDRVIPDPENDSDDTGNDNGDVEDSPPGDNSPGNDNGDVEDSPPGDNSPGNDNGSNDSDGTCNCNPEEAPAICAGGDSDGILIAHENCNQFYKCDHGKPVAFTCPNDLLYNPITEVCDWPKNVECGDRVIPDKEDDSSNNGNDSGGDNDTDSGNGDDSDSGNDNEGIDNDIGNDPDDNLGNDSVNDPDDNMGNDSVNDPDDNLGNDSVNDPNDNLGNDSDGNNENDVDDTECEENDKGEPCNCKPDEAPSICAIDGSDGVLIAHENCNQFYKCSNGKPYPFKCPVNLFYNPVTEVCDWASNVECGDRVIPDPEDDDNESESKEIDTEDNNDGTCNCNPEEAPAICSIDGSEGVLIAHENCNQFYTCSAGKPVALTCPTNLLYNPFTEQCDWASNVECGDRVIPEPEDNENVSDIDDSEIDSGNDNNVVNDDPSQAPMICAESGSNGVLVAHENCEQFYLCSGGAPVAMSCAGELLFNPINQQCDWPRNVDCGDRIVPESSDDSCACNPRNAPALCSRQNSDGQLIAHEICNQFYVCVEGVPQARVCAANLHYNVDKQVCDWQQNVDCGSRMVFTSLNKHLESRQTLRN